MRLSEQLKSLAKGINPITGECLDESSGANNPNAIRLLFSLAEEIARSEDSEDVGSVPAKLSDDEKRAINIAKGKPGRSHFRWYEDERERLVTMFQNETSIEDIASKLERSKLAVAVQLHKKSLITDEQYQSYGGRI